MTAEGFPELAFRVGAFLVVFSLMAWLELRRPRRPSRHTRRARWPTNIAIVLIDSAVVRAMSLLAVPLVAVAAAEFAASNGLGLFNVIGVPTVATILLSILVLDFAVWLQHVASHKIPALWRLHQMHHADQDFDATTAIRFHPIEIALSMLWKSAWVVMLGAPPVAVLLFEIILNCCAVFNHANVALPSRLDRVLRRLIVTPDMHRVHHSVLQGEHNSNYGFNFSVWDWLFKTYTAQPTAGHDGMTIGLVPYQAEGPTRLSWCLILPFKPWRNHS